MHSRGVLRKLNAWRPVVISVKLDRRDGHLFDFHFTDEHTLVVDTP